MPRQSELCPFCHRPIISPMPGFSVVQQRIYDVVHHHPGISAGELRRAVWASSDDCKTLHIQVGELNRQLAASGVCIRSQGGGYQLLKI